MTGDNMDDGNADVYYVERNAVTDHRTVRPTVVTSPRQPPYIPPVPINPAGGRVIYGGQVGGQAQLSPWWSSNGPVYVPPPPPWSWPGQPGWPAQPGTLGALFGGLNGINMGSLVDLVGQGFAAIRSLPTPPTASGDLGTDIANLTLYQTALADHGKTDEQIRTAVHIIAKLLGG